jgi:haloacid dehalogenase-like hydrolase
VLAGDLSRVLAGRLPALAEIVIAPHSGMTIDEFGVMARDWLAITRHPKTNKLFTEMVFQPMLELLTYLRANGFKTFIVSGGGIEFMRTFAEVTYGVPPEQVIGSSGKLKFEMRDGEPVLTKLVDKKSLTTTSLNPSSFRTISAVASSRRSAIPTVTLRCFSGRPPEKARGSPCLFTTLTRLGNGRTTAPRLWGSSTRRSMKRTLKTGRSSI